MSLRVVVVEDETLTRIDLIEILKENGYDVVGEATDGIEAVEICKKLQPDIVLLDIKIPYISGLKVANILKEDGFKGCIIILTAYNIAEYIQEASNTIVMGYILKPIDEPIFLERFASLRYGRYSFSSGSFMKGDWIFGKFSKFGISQGSVPFPKYPSERRMTGVVYSKAIFAASKAASKQSEGDCGAITGMGASPFLPCTAAI